MTDRSRERKARVVVLGLDGATWDLLSPMMALGWMPALAGLVAGGTSAILRSTLPPLTAPAWSTFMTGLNPGRHSVFSFQRPLNRELRRTFVDADDIRAPLLWQHLTRHELTTGALNVPMTYPLRPVRGWGVSGMMTPSEAVAFATPPELADVLRAREYVVDLRVLAAERAYRKPVERLALVNDLTDVLLKRQAALEEVLWPPAVDLLVVVYETPDRLQHWTWSYIADLLGSGAFERTPIHAAVEAAYRALDACMARTLDLAAGPETTVIVMSDHGFGPRHTRIHLDEWLAREGWLAFAGSKAGLRRRLKPYMRTVKRIVPRPWLHAGRRAFSVPEIIDWSRTVAYSGVSSEYALYLNVAGREPYGQVAPGRAYEELRTAIMERLLRLEDPRTGGRVVTAVFRREELHAGPFVELAPDFLFELAPGYEPSSEVSAAGVFSDVGGEGEGMHLPDGIFLASGPGILSQSLAERRTLADVAPTICYVMGLPVPEGLDGRVIEQLFDSGRRSARPVTYEPAADEVPLRTADTGGTRTADDEALLEERLRALGYLD